ncbi:putative Polyketide synthetase [Seiridium unicorne]|uniref:Polyketide synthetase n=1 Tax=Seiridium unicorne TaxID=138068 RepID=A0ABR2UN66_9PEZI
MLSTECKSNEPIAIIGSGCRFPGGASSPSKLWELLSKPRDVLSEIPHSRFDARGFYHPKGDTPGHSNVLHSYVLEEDVRAWDADFFKISANEAVAIDPQQRLLMETVYEALDIGGQRLHDLRGSDTAVYVGLMGEEYSIIQGRELEMMPTYHATGTARSIVSNRISYFFDWHGASMTIDTACSSSLVAVHQGVQALRSGASRLAVAAGTNLLLGPEPYISESTFHMLSPRGRSHMWDAGADGYGRGEGVAAVVLKRLSDAIADGDAIECVIRETGVNQDGRTNGITVPSPTAQVALIQDTYRRAGLDLSSPADRPQFFEAHGTGTGAGDPLEAEAIHRAIGTHLREGDKLYVGSIKTVVGHTEGTAGIAGLMKVSLALQNRLIPPNMLFERLNPAIEPFYKGLEVPVGARSWPSSGNSILRASVNSFGFGGTNAHAIVERYERPSKPSAAADNSFMGPYTFSAVSKTSLRRMLLDTVAYVEASPNVRACDLAHTLNSRRSTFTFRASCFARDLDELKKRIRESTASPEWENQAVVQPPNRPTKILGIFTGQGAQWPGMGKQLLQDFPSARDRIRELEMALATLPPGDRPSWSLRAELEAEGAESKLHLAEFAQPLCTALQILLVDLLYAANVQFAAVVGHSSGEMGAAYAAGVLSARDAIVVAYYRGVHTKLARGGNTDHPGAMLAVGTSPEDAEEFVNLPEFEGRLSVAACNSPSSVTLSGDADAVEEAKNVFVDEGKFARALRVDKAYHSHHMRPCTIPYVTSLRKAGVVANRPRAGCQWYSSVTKGLVHTGDAEDELNGMYWARNMAQTVLFADAVESACMEEQYTMAIEVGPHGTLRGPAMDTISAAGSSTPSYISCLARNTDSSETFGQAMGQIWANAAEGVLDLGKYHITAHGLSGPRQSQSILKDLPNYPWDNKRVFWNESRRSRALRLRTEPGHAYLGTLSPDANETAMSWHQVLRLTNLPWIKGHQLQGQTVFPAAGYVALAVEAARYLAKTVTGSGSESLHTIELRDLDIGKAIAFENDKSGVELVFSLHVLEKSELEEGRWTVDATFDVRSVTGESTHAQLNASGHMQLGIASTLNGETCKPAATLPGQEEGPSSMTEVDDTLFYSELKQLGYQYSGAFRALHSMTRKLDYGRGYIAKVRRSTMHSSEKDLLVHPGYLDAAFQAMFLAFSYPGDGRIWSLHVPVSIRRIQIDVQQCAAANKTSSEESRLAFDASIRADTGLLSTSKFGISGDVDIFSADSTTGLIQVEDIRLTPFAPAVEAQDTQMFHVNTWGVAAPDGELICNQPSPEDTEIALLLERMAYWYLRNLVATVRPEEEARASSHHRKLIEFAKRSIAALRSAKPRYAKKEWLHDTAEALEPLMQAFRDQVDVQLLRKVGEHLAEAVRGDSDVLEHMDQDGLLAKWHDQSLGLQETTRSLAEIVLQITHVDPHMRILEIGGGNGHATRRVLEKAERALAHYTFTDGTTDAIEAARGQFTAYHGRMAFQLLDTEADVVAQGFQANSYDLVFGASSAFHAQKDAAAYLLNLRKLLRPGGFLVLLENTSAESIRLSAILGGLESWWRAPSASLSTADWNSLLLQSGFSGVDTSTPELDPLVRPYSVLVSRATNDHINLLLEPSVIPSDYSQIDELVIFSGRSLHSIRLAETTRRLLERHCKRIIVLPGVKDWTQSYPDANNSPRSTVLYLADLDEPVFARYTPEAHAGLQRLWATAQNVLWVTRGARRDDPHAIMSLGLGRAMAVEQAHAQIGVQFMDFPARARPDAHLLVDELLRLQILGNLRREGGSGTELRWVREPEVEVDELGRKWVPRIVPHPGFNDLYNASRRAIVAEVNPASEVVEVHHDDHGRSVIRVLAPEVRRKDSQAREGGDGEEIITVRVLYSDCTPLRPSSGESLYACVGLDDSTQLPVIALSPYIASVVEAAKSSVVRCNYSLSEAPWRLHALTTQLLASLICHDAAADAFTLLLEPSEELARSVTGLAVVKNVQILCVTTSPAKRETYPAVYLHSGASGRVISKALPANVASVVDFTEFSSSGGDGSFLLHLQRYLPAHVVCETAEAFHARKYRSSDLTELFRQLVHSPASQALTKVDTVSVNTYTSHPYPSTSSIIDWLSSDTVSVSVKPSDVLPILRGDRTYLLFGLGAAGGLGLPLAEYMIGLGARNIVITSRKPRIDGQLLATYAAKGIKVEIIANDITDEDDVKNLIAKVRASWPPIAGVANGANVLNDMQFHDMTYEDMYKVLAPKVEGTRILDQIFFDEPLDFFIGFSSISIVLGRSGQSNYDTANIYMLGLASQRRARGLNASVIDIGPVTGLGLMARDYVSENVMNLLVSHGYRKLSGHDFLTTFANGILAGRVNSGEPEELITGLTAHPYKGRFQPTWSGNARFSHLMLNTDGSSSGMASEDSTQMESLEDLLKKSRTTNDIARVLRAAVLNKLQNILSLSDELIKNPESLLQQGTSALGLDSLLAVELRTWMLRELGVDMPVLKILSDAPIQGLVDFAVENLPPVMAPSLNPDSKDDAIPTEALQKPEAKDNKVEIAPAIPLQSLAAKPSASPSNTTPTTASAVPTPSTTSPAPSVSDELEDSMATSESSSPVKTADLDKVMPMSFGQSRFWVMSQIVEDPYAFNISCHVEISSEVDVAAFGRAVEVVAARHEALRTCFFDDGDDRSQPMQGVMKESPLRLETTSASSADIDGLFREVHNTVYDLERGATMRALLVSTSRTQHHLLVGYHHINMDSTSFFVFISDVIKVYSGRKPAPPRVQYTAFAEHQRDQLNKGRWDEHMAFWTGEFAVLPDPLPILRVSSETSRARPSLTTYANRTLETRVSTRVARQVQTTARKLKVTPFHLYTTVLQVTLARLGAIDDVCIGMADANRSDVGAIDSVGNFLNLLALRLPTRADTSFATLVRATKTKVLQALGHSAVPFDVVMERVGIRRSATHSPLFQAFIDYRYVTEKLPFGTGFLEGKEYILSKTPYDVMVEMIDTPTGEASLKLLVQEALYSQEDAEVILGCFTSLLDAFTKNSDLLVGQVQMFNESQVQKAIEIGQGEFLELGHSSFVSEVDEIAVGHPDAVALQDSRGGSVSYSDLKARSTAIGKSLDGLGLPVQSRIGVFHEPDVDWICSMLGVWRAGHTYVPLETSQGLQRLADVAKEAQLTTLLIHDATMPLVSGLALNDAVRVVNVSTLAFNHFQHTSSVTNHNLKDEAMIIYTSGSTGVPKGISIPHRVVVNAARSFLHRWPMSPQTVLQQTALSFDVSWWGAIIGLATKGTVVVAGPEARRDPKSLTDLIVSKKVTFTFAVPSESVAWIQGGDAAALRSSAWAWHCSGGEPYSLNLIKHLQMLNKPDLRAINIFGPTETMIPNAHEVLYRSGSANYMPVPIGRVMPNFSARVVDPQGHPVPAGIPGELLFGGAGIADGYVGNPSLTAERFPQDRLARSEFKAWGWDLVHHSGDQGYLRPSDGQFILQGRIDGDTQVKLRGLRIDMLDIEAQILATAEGQVSDAVVHVRKPKSVSQNTNAGTEFLVAHVLLARDASIRGAPAAERRSFLERVVKELRMPDYMRPAMMVVVDTLPLTHHGKVDRKALPRLPLDVAEEADDKRIHSPKLIETPSDLESSASMNKVKKLWLSVLGESAHAHTLRADSDFFLVGGNSLLLIRVQGELRKRYGLDVPLTQLFQSNTLAQMAALIEGQDTKAGALSNTSAAIDWAREIKLQPELSRLRHAPALSPSPKTGLVVALTGASGFLGLELVRNLVQRPDVQTVHALAVRNRDKLASQITSTKLVIHQGDLSKPGLGLSEKVLDGVLASAHTLIHNGADVSFLKSYSSVRATNLASTQELVRRAVQHGRALRRVHYVSTAGIATMLMHDLYEESLGRFPPVQSPEGYVLSKWASELYLERASAATGLPVTVHRPTAIVGENAPHLDVMSNILHYSRLMATVPSMDALEGSFQFVPVEDVARGMLAAVFDREFLDGQDIGAHTAAVQYRNHNGHAEDTVDVHQLAPYLSKLLNKPVTVTPDPEWITLASAQGMPDEVVEYMKGVNLATRGGEKWTFPRALNGPQI